MNGLPDELLVDVGTIAIRGVDEIDAQFRYAPENVDRLLPIGRLTPCIGPVEAHRAISEPIDFHIAADPENPGLRSAVIRHLCLPDGRLAKGRPCTRHQGLDLISRISSTQLK